MASMDLLLRLFLLSNRSMDLLKRLKASSGRFTASWGSEKPPGVGLKPHGGREKPHGERFGDD